MGDAVVSIELPYQVEEKLQEKEPKAIMDRMTIKRKEMIATKVLVKWKH